MKSILTDEEVELEIERLSSCDDVQLARAELRIKYKRRQYLYQLRSLAKRGQELREAGITRDNLNAAVESVGKEIDSLLEPSE